MPTFPLTGRCLCGAVRFEVDSPLVSANYCHCARCRRRTGTAASAQAAIERCGSALFSQSQADPAKMTIRMGAFDSDPGIRPQARHHVGTAAVWEPIPDDGLPRHEGGRT
jgi:hypothetical protein